MMAGYQEDDIAWPTMVSITAEIENQLALCGLPGVCRNTVVPGPLAVLEACGSCGKGGGGECGGQAWVRFVTEYPSQEFPAADQSGSNCDSPMAYTLEVGIARCLPVGSPSALSGFNIPAISEMVAATRLQMADKRVMRRAIKAVANRSDKAYSIGTYNVMQAQGDCGGGVWLVTFWSQ